MTIDGFQAGGTYSRTGLTRTMQAAIFSPIAPRQDFVSRIPESLVLSCREFSMGMSDEIVADLHSDIITTSHFFQCVSMELSVFCLPHEALTCISRA